MLRPGPLLPALLFVATLAGCAEDPGRGAVRGSLFVPACGVTSSLDLTCPDAAACDAFSLVADFFAVETFGRRAVIRLQAGGRPLGQSDGFIVDIADTDRLVLGQPVAVGPDGPVRAALSLFDRCPESPQSFLIVGEITFDAFGTGAGDRVAAAFTGLQVFDGRGPADAPLGVLRGDFDFRVLKGSTRQRYVDD